MGTCFAHGWQSMQIDCPICAKHANTNSGFDYDSRIEMKLDLILRKLERLQSSCEKKPADHQSETEVGSQVRKNETKE